MNAAAIATLKIPSPTVLTFRGPPRPGLIPQSGDPEHPYRWIRPESKTAPKANSQAGRAFEPEDSASMNGWGKEHFESWYYNQLNDDERRSASRYTGSDYQQINGSLRGKMEADSRTREEIRGLTSALDKSAIPEDVVTYRGISSGRHLGSMNPGDTFVDPGFTSTSLSSTSSSMFGGSGRGYLVEVIVPKGTKGGYLFSGAEQEVLLQRGTKFVVESKDPMPDDVSSIIRDRKILRMRVRVMGQEPVEAKAGFEAEHQRPKFIINTGSIDDRFIWEDEDLELIEPDEPNAEPVFSLFADFANCPPPLVEKAIIDRLGRKGTRCINPNQKAVGVPGGVGDALIAPSAAPPKLSPEEAKSQILSTTKGKLTKTSPKKLGQLATQLSNADGGARFVYLGDKDFGAVLPAPGILPDESYSDWKDRMSLESARRLIGNDAPLPDVMPDTTQKPDKDGFITLGEDVNPVRDANDQVREKMGVLKTRSPFMAQITGFDTKGWEADPVNSPGGQVIQSAVSEIFEGSPDRFSSDVQAAGGRPPKVAAARKDQAVAELKQSMEAEHAFWRERLGDNGTIRMYRGISTDDKQELGAVPLSGFPAESWTTDPSVASGFGNTMLARDVPINQIVTSHLSLLSSPTAETMNMSEFIVYTPPEGVDAEVIASAPPGIIERTTIARSRAGKMR